MLRPKELLVVGATLAWAVSAADATYTAHFSSTISPAMQSDVARLGTDTTPAGKSQLAALNKMVKALAKGSEGPETFTNDARTAARLARTADAKLATDAATYLALDGPCWQYYAANVRAARDALQLALTAQRLSKGATKKLTKKLAAADKAIASFPPGKAAGPLATKYAALASAATATDGFASFDSGAAHSWVVSALTVAPPTEGFDLDGDGSIDNFVGGLPAALQAAGLNFDLDAALADRIATSPDVGVIQMWNVHSLDSDPLVFAGFTNADDTDGNPQDNFTGTETFAGKNLAADGHPVIRTTTSFTGGGAYLIDIEGTSIEVAGVALASDLRVKAKGTASSAQNTGLIGGALPVQALLDYLAQEGITLPSFAQSILVSQADIDTDGNGSNDAFSCALRFTAVAATITGP